MTARPDILAVIPARGGSKSVPRKNLKILGGRPLIVHSIDAARQSQLITRVIVSTDDDEIADVARRFGAEVPFIRPAELARDDTPDFPVFRHALEWLEREERYRPELVVQLRPTAPMRRVDTIDRAVAALLARPEMDSLRAVSLAKETPFKMWFIGASGELQPVVTLPGVGEAYNMPRQSLPKAYWQNGYIDISRPATIQAGSMTGTRILSFVVDEPCVEIDYEEHFAAAERMFAGGGLEVPASATDRFPS